MTVLQLRLLPEIREVPGFPGYYASTDGHVFSCWGRGYRRSREPRGELSELSRHRNWEGYLSVRMRREARTVTRLVHAVVLETFVGPRPEGMETRHLDGDPANNRLDNLIWGTTLENKSDRAQHGKTARGTRNGRAKLTEDQVRLIRQMDESDRVLAARFGVSPRAIALIRNGENWRHVS